MIRPSATLEQEHDERSPNDERRASVRHRAPLCVHCRLVKDAGTNWCGRLRDVSTLGIGLILPERLELGILLEIDLQRSSGMLVRRELARIVHVQEGERRNEWLVGAAFIGELSAAELSLFHAQAIRLPANDCRRWVRFPCNVETVCYTSETVPGERRPARILNVSPGGIGLLLPCQFSEGTLLHFELPAEDHAARALLVRAVRVIEQSPGMWFLGCEFVSQIGEDELRWLLR